MAMARFQPNWTAVQAHAVGQMGDANQGRKIEQAEQRPHVGVVAELELPALFPAYGPSVTSHFWVHATGQR